MLISVEHELPTHCLRGGHAVSPEVFTDLWKQLSAEGWTPDGSYGISRQSHSSVAMKPVQAITTDTGPTIEIAPCPAEEIAHVEKQLKDLRTLIGKKLQGEHIGLLGSGVHLRLGDSRDEYYRYRTPRLAYNYAVDRRGWQHRTILHVAAMQEVVDVPIAQAPTILAAMHRLAGAVLFLCRNDPDFSSGQTSRLLTIRPAAWRNHVPNTGPFEADRHKVYLPENEVDTWGSYLRLLWESNPMFLLGTKADGLVYIPDHPTFASFITSPAREGWEARRLDTDEVVRVVPEMVHVAQSDWTYMGFARLKLFWKDGTSLQELVRAYQLGSRDIDTFLENHLQKVLLENRSSACPMPGNEMCSLALVVGLLENFAKVNEYVRQRPYSFWLRFAKMAEHAPLSSRIDSVETGVILSQVLSLARTGLKRRGFGEGAYLEPMAERVAKQESPSEITLALHKAGGMDAVAEQLLYRFDR